MNFEIESTLQHRFPGLHVVLKHVSSVKVKKSSDELQKVKEEVCKKVKEKYTIEFLKDVPIFRAYRDFFWKVGVDPTKTRPAAEALIRRIVAGKPIPTINNVVDSYNLASIQSGVALAAFDSKVLHGDLLMREADNMQGNVSLFFLIPVNSPFHVPVFISSSMISREICGSGTH